MTSTWIFSAIIVFGICASLQCSTLQDSSAVEDPKSDFKRAGGGKLTRYALKQLARSLRNNRSLAWRVVNRLESWSGKRISANKIIDVIDGVANRLDRYQSATCNFFADVGVSVGLNRRLGYFICQVALDLLV